MMINISLSGDQRAQMNLLKDLMVCIKNGNYAQIQKLDSTKLLPIINRVDPNFKETPMLAACLITEQQTAFIMIRMLVDRGANPEFKDNYQQTVLFYLARDGKFKILEYLLNNYIYDINSKDYCEQTPIFYSSRDNRLNVTELLVSKGANVNHKDKNGQTCLFYAASNGHYDMCRVLINFGAEIFHMDYDKRTALSFAKNSKSPNKQQVVDLINSYKNKDKKIKEIEKIRDKESSAHLMKKPKKESVKADYVLVYTDQQGNIHELTSEQLQQFKRHNQRVFQLMCNPEQLDLQPTPPQRKFQKIASRILNNFWKMPGAIIFHIPVNWQLHNALDYPNVIKRPMDFGTIKTKLQNNAYKDHLHFAEDMILVFDNCILYNGSGHEYGKIAMNMKKEFGTVYSEFLIS